MLELTMRDDEKTRILKRFGEAGQRSRVQKMERLAADLARIEAQAERELRDEEERAEILERVERLQSEKRRREAEGRQKQMRSVRKETFGDKVAEAVATSDVLRKVMIVAQEVTNSPLNPMSVYMRLGNWLTGDGYRTGLEDVVKPETAAEHALAAGTRVLYDTLAAGGYTNVLAGSKYAKQAYDASRILYETKKLGRSYDKLSQDPFLGDANDVIAVMRPRDQEAIYVQRGYAVKKGDDLVVTQGRALKPDTISNFGMNKIMRTHGMTKQEVQGLPKMVRENKPAEVTSAGRQTYYVRGKKGEDYRIATSPKIIKGKERQNLSSFYEDGTEKTSVSEINWTPLPRVYKTPK